MSSAIAYNRPARPYQSEIEVKRSRFVADLMPLTQDPRVHIQAIRQTQPKAGHHCWAYVGDPDSTDRDSSDDGEPKGTAGKPMLAMLQGLDLGQTLVVVSRYFGGVKLGTGGLVRAYGQAVRAAIEQAELIRVEPRDRINLEFPYDQAGWVESLRRELKAEPVESVYGERIQVVWEVEAARGDSVRAELAAHSHLGLVLYKQ
jgi:uncharacterized YigZ family protein